GGWDRMRGGVKRGGGGGGGEGRGGVRDGFGGGRELCAAERRGREPVHEPTQALFGAGGAPFTRERQAARDRVAPAPLVVVRAHHIVEPEQDVGELEIVVGQAR